MFWDNFLIHCRKIRKSPSAVAKEIGISTGAVARWKEGSIPQSETLAKVADYFGVTITEFFLMTGVDSSGISEPARKLLNEISKISDYAAAFNFLAPFLPDILQTLAEIDCDIGILDNLIEKSHLFTMHISTADMLDSVKFREKFIKPLRESHSLQIVKDYEEFYKIKKELDGIEAAQNELAIDILILQDQVKKVALGYSREARKETRRLNSVNNFLLVDEGSDEE